MPSAISLSQFNQVKSSAYSAKQVSRMMDEGGVEPSLRALGTAGGGVLGGAFGLASSMYATGQPDLATATVGAAAGAGLGNVASRGAIALMRRQNKKYEEAERLTGIPRSKLEELPLSTRFNLLSHAGKTAADFSASQLREYQMKNLEPGIGALIDATGAVSGGLAGRAVGEQFEHPILGTIAGMASGSLMAHLARKKVQEGIEKRYLTRRVMEAASGAPLSTQTAALRSDDPSSVSLGVEKLIAGSPRGQTLRLSPSPAVAV